MFEKITDYFRDDPRRMTALGSFLMGLGAALIVAGLFARIATVAIGNVGRMAGQLAPTKMLADIYPTLPTWWIPESISGAVLAIVIAAAGLWFNQTGKQYTRWIR